MTRLDGGQRERDAAKLQNRGQAIRPRRGNKGCVALGQSRRAKRAKIIELHSGKRPTAMLSKFATKGPASSARMVCSFTNRACESSRWPRVECLDLLRRSDAVYGLGYCRTKSEPADQAGKRAG